MERRLTASGRPFRRRPPLGDVPALSIITKQTEADTLPTITQQYPDRNMNDEVIRVNTQLAGPEERR